MFPPKDPLFFYMTVGRVIRSVDLSAILQTHIRPVHASDLMLPCSLKGLTVYVDRFYL